MIQIDTDERLARTVYAVDEDLAERTTDLIRFRRTHGLLRGANPMKALRERLAGVSLAQPIRIPDVARLPGKET